MATSATYLSTARRVLPPKPKSIAAQAISAHPAWATPPRQTSITGQALAAHPVWAAPIVNNPNVPGTAAAKAAGAAGQAPGVSATQAPQPPQPSPLDAQYNANVAMNTFKVNQSIGSLNQQDTNNSVNLQTALAALAYQQPRDQLTTEQNANRRGALYSSVYNQQAGDLAHKYATQQTADQTGFNQKHGAIQSQIAGLKAGIPIYNQGQAQASAARVAALIAANPATGAPLSVPITKPAAVPPGQAAKPGQPPKAAAAQNEAAKASTKLKQAIQAQKQKAKAKSFSSTMKRVK